jgi:GH24 family phage-related lysozyme (muramidase)
MAFSDLVRYQKSQGKGVIGSLSGAVGQATLQKIDPRNYLFNRRGTLATLFPGLKGYQAKTSSENLGSASGGFSAGQVEVIGNKLDQLSAQMSMVAKNSLSLPMMARDMNVMRQNIVKLVKAQGVKPAQRADAFFLRAGERERAYESQFGKKSTSPTPIGTPNKTDGNVGLLATLVTTVGNIISTTLTQGLKSIADIITGAMSSLAEIISSALQALGMAIAGKSILGGGIPDIGSGGKGGKGTPPKGKLARLGGAAVGAAAFTGLSIAGGYASDYVMDKTGASVDPGELEKLKSKDEANWQKMSIGEKIESGAARGVEKVGGFLGFDRLSERATAERIKSESDYLAKNQRSPSPVGQGSVSEDLVNYVKQKEGFTPIAKKDYAQYSIGYGTKANSPNEGPITEEEADKRLREVLAKAQKNVIDHAAKYGYNWDQKKIDALTSFTYNLGPGALNQLTANGTRKDDEIGKKILEYNKAGGQVLSGLVARRTEESSTFSSGVSLVASSPNTGSRVSSASTALAAANRPSGTSNQVIDNKTINNNTQTGSSGGTQVAAYDSDMMRYLLRPVS